MPRLAIGWFSSLVLFAALGCRTEPYPATALARDGGADLRARGDLADAPAGGAIGDACTLPNNVFGRGTCATDQMICVQEGYPDGYCTQICKGYDDPSCPGEAACFFVTPGVFRCMKLCNVDGDCRPSYECHFRGYCERTFE